MLGGLTIMDEVNVQPIKTSVGESIYLYLEIQMKLNSESTISMSSQDKYYYEKKNDNAKQTEEVRLSNFIIEPLFIIENGNEPVRYLLKFITKQYSKVVEIKGGDLAISSGFTKYCTENGKFIWKGKQHHMHDLAEFIMDNADKKLTTLTYSGFNTREHIWFYPTHAYAKGKVYYPDESGIFEINDKYYRLELDKDEDYVIYPPIMASPTKPSITKFFNDLKKLYGNYFYLTFGYIASSFHADAISTKTDNFPFMYIYGKQSSGKSTIMNIFSKFSGMKVSLTSPPSLDGLRKGISRRANVPFVIDEAEDKDDRSRGRDFIKYYSDVLKVIYMRQSLVRGHKDENAVIRYPIRGTLFLGGEVLTSVASIIQRSILIDSSKIIKNEVVFSGVRESKIPIWVGQYLMKSMHEWQSNVLELYDEISKYFIKQGWSSIDVRVRSNYAIFLAGAFAALKQLNRYFNEEIFLADKEELKEIYLFVYGEMKETQRMTETDHPSNKFLSKIGLLANNKVLCPNVDYKCEKQKDGNVLLYLAPTNVMAAYKDHEKHPFYSTSNKAVKDIQNQSYFKGTKKTRIGKSQPSAWMLQLTNPENPELIQEGIVHPDLPDTMIYFYHG